MADIDLSNLNIDQLTDLVGKAQSEMASRERKRRKDLRSEIERRISAEGYKMGDIFPELGGRRWKWSTSPEAAGQVPQSAKPRRDLERHRSHSEVGRGDSRGARD